MKSEPAVVNSRICLNCIELICKLRTGGRCWRKMPCVNADVTGLKGSGDR